MKHYARVRREPKVEASLRARVSAKGERLAKWRARRAEKHRARFEHDSSHWIDRPMQLSAAGETAGAVRALVVWPCETCGCPPTFDGCPLCQSL